MSTQKYPQNSTSTSNPTNGRRAATRNGHSFAKQQARRNRRRNEAEDRNAKYEALTLKEKLASLIPGGSNRQRAKLNKLAEKAKAPMNKTAPLTSEQKGAKAVKRAQDAVAALPHGGSSNK